MRILFISPYPVKKLSEWTQTFPFALSGHQICFSDKRFAYLEWIRNQDYLPFVLIIDQRFLLQGERLFFKNLIDEGWLIGVFYQDFSELKTLQIPSPSSIHPPNEPIQIPYELGLIHSIWKSLPFFKMNGLIEGFVHNISSPITAISGKLSLAQMTGKNLGNDEKFAAILEQLTAMIRNFQWYNESLDYNERQRIAVQENITNMLELMKSNLIFKHRIQVEYQSLSPSLVLKTSPTGFNFMIFSLLENVADQIPEESKILPLIMTSQIEGTTAIIRLVFPIPLSADLKTIRFVITDAPNRLGLSLTFLNWTYFIPEEIELSSFLSNDQQVIQLQYKMTD
ncbi:MAG: hypothetical protein KBA26_01780 [Candidatus Delongbacteria bacterium]|nr:hypothetical protein [Candidatus Delongbacteria bacterium]